MEALRLVTETGRRIGRVRFVELPMTEYSRHEFEVAYPRTTAAGEEIHVLDRALHPEFDHVREGFVVFDEASVMWYYTGPKEVAQYRAAYERLADLALRGTEVVSLIHRVRSELLTER